MNITKEFMEKVHGLQTEDWEQVDRMLKTLRYLIGIAERGEGRKCGEEESPEQFVLNYVKKLEAAAPTPPAPDYIAAKNDRDMLLYLHERFENEVHNCEVCGNADETKTFDSASALRDYLAAAPTPPATEALEDARNDEREVIACSLEAAGHHELARKIFAGMTRPIDEKRRNAAIAQIPGLRLNTALSDEDIKAISEYIAPAPKGDWEEVQRLLKTIRYVQGIAERGEGRKMRDDETLEQFLLTYVKKLEAPEVEPVAWMIPSILPSGPYKGSVAWKPSVFCDSQKQPRIDESGKRYYPYPLDSRPANDALRKAARKVIASFNEHIDAGHPLPYWAVRDLQNLRAELDKGKS